MANGAQIGFKRKTRTKFRLRNKGSDESDEDYKVSEDEVEESEDEFRSLVVADESEDSLEEFCKEEEEWMEKKVKRVGMPKARKIEQVRKKNRSVKPRNKRVSHKEEVDDDSDDYEDGFFSFKKVRKSKASLNKEEAGGFFSFKKVKKNYAAEESAYDCEYDTEFIPDEIGLDRVTRTRVKRQSKSDTSKEVSDEKPITVRTKKRTTRCRGRRFSVDPNSDVANSGSNDYEYTISEEEREQVREAGKLCSGLPSGLRVSGPLRITNEETQRKQPIMKGKEKVTHMKVKMAKQVCGICLSEEGKRTIQGVLNCCNHYFCFACIMEWSKVESRCPLCKQRFTNINRKGRANGGHDLRDAVFQVPERDQVYQPSDEELMTYFDPYEGATCSECHLGGDDALMLLCDLCDSPAHTYCVGFGHEVPEGNWYCDGCRPTANTSSNPHPLNPIPNHGTANIFYVSSSPPRPTVRETFDLNEAYVPETELTAQLPSHPQSARTSYADRQSSSFASAPTLERRRIRRQMHHFTSIGDRHYEGTESTAPAEVSGINLFGSWISLNRTVEHRGPSVSRGQALHGEPSASSLSYAAFPTQNEVVGMNETSGMGFVHHHLHPCTSSRSNNGVVLPCEMKEGTLSSRTLQRPLYSHHF